MKPAQQVKAGSAPPQRNDLTIYHTHERAWWDGADPFFMPLRALAPARLRFLMRSVPELTQGTILDLGCGGGYLTLPLTREGIQVTGLDRAEGALRAARTQAQKEGLNVNLVCGDAETLPFESETFSGVVCTDLLVHVPDPARVLLEIGRVLRPGGWLYFSTLNRTWLSRLVMITLAEDWLGLVPRGTHDPQKFIRPAELHTFLANAGLQPVHCEGLGPVGLSTQGVLKFGWIPGSLVMYHGLVRKPGRPAAHTLP